MIGLLGALITWVLSLPGGPVFLEQLALALFERVLMRDNLDPVFRQAFLDLSGGLVNAENEGEKRAILVKIRELRKSTPTV